MTEEELNQILNPPPVDVQTPPPPEEIPDMVEEPTLLEKIGAILQSHGGLESNIPLTHEYWDLTAKARMK